MHCRITLSACLLLLLCQESYGADNNYLRNTIKDYFSDTRNHEVNNDYKTRAKEFIYQEFKKNGLETEYHIFNYLDLTKTVSFTNVVGVLKGDNFGTADDKIIGLGAHYDTVPDTKGVDDNGAGVAAMLEVVRQLAAQNKNGVKRKNTVMFVSFDLEEYGLVGSEVFIQQWLNPWLVKEYGDASRSLIPHGIIVLDTMMEYNTSARSQHIPDGAEDTFQTLFLDSFTSITSDNFRGDFLAMIYRASSDQALAESLRSSWAAEARSQFEFESFPLPFTNVGSLDTNIKDSLGNFFRSDHYNFWVDNIPAIFLTDSANFRGDMIQCYHHPCDNLETMLTDENINFLGKAADSIASSMNQLSAPINAHTSGCTDLTYSIVFCAVMMYAGSLVKD